MWLKKRKNDDETDPDSLDTSIASSVSAEIATADDQPHHFTDRTYGIDDWRFQVALDANLIATHVIAIRDPVAVTGENIGILYFEPNSTGD